MQDMNIHAHRFKDELPVRKRHVITYAVSCLGLLLALRSTAENLRWHNDFDLDRERMRENPQYSVPASEYLSKEDLKNGPRCVPAIVAEYTEGVYL